MAQVREEEKVYDEVSEAEYARIVAQKRAEAGDFVVGDEELGYNDIGEDDWHRYEEAQDDSDDEDLSESRQKKAKKIAAAREYPGRLLAALLVIPGEQSSPTPAV